MIQKYELTDAKTVSTTADLNVKLRKNDSVSKQVNWYWTLSHISQWMQAFCMLLLLQDQILHKQLEQYQYLMEIQQKLI